MPLSQGLEGPQRCILPLKEPEMEPRRFFLHPLECPQVVLNQCQRTGLVRHNGVWSR